MPTSDPSPSNSSGSSDSGEWVIVRKRNPWPRRIAVVILVLAVTACTLYWKRAALRHYANDWSADRHLAHAERELAAGNHRVALSRALTAIELEPRRIAPLRVLCTSAREIRDSRLLVYATALAGHPEATDEDRIAALAVFAEVGDARRFSAVFEALPGALQASPEARLLRLQHRLRLGEGAGVLAALEIDLKLLEVWPGPLLRLEGLWQRAHPGDDATAAELAVELLQRDLDPEDRKTILEKLSQLPPARIPADGAAALQEVLGAEAGSGEPVTLRDTLAIAAKPERREAIVDSAVARLGTESPGALCRWLAAQGDADMIIKVTENSRVLSDPVAYEARARALIERERYDEALALLRYPVRSTDAMEIAILEAAAARGLGSSSDETAAWRRAQLAADSDLTRNRYLGLATAATRAGQREVAVDAIVAACRHPVGLLPPAREIAWVMNELVKSDRPNDLLAVLARLLSWEGSDPVLVNNAIYLSLILEQPVGSAAVEVMEEIVEDHPEKTGFRNTLAFARIVAGDAGSALAIYEEENVSDVGGAAFWSEFSNAGRAVYAFALAESGEDKRFREVAESIDWDTLLESERRYFEGQLRPHQEPEEEAREI